MTNMNIQGTKNYGIGEASNLTLVGAMNKSLDGQLLKRIKEGETPSTNIRKRDKI